jgi:hypothetical protein
MDHHTQ